MVEERVSQKMDGRQEEGVSEEINNREMCGKERDGRGMWESVGG